MFNLKMIIMIKVFDMEFYTLDDLEMYISHLNASIEIPVETEYDYAVDKACRYVRDEAQRVLDELTPKFRICSTYEMRIATIEEVENLNKFVAESIDPCANLHIKGLLMQVHADTKNMLDAYRQANEECERIDKQQSAYDTASSKADLHACASVEPEVADEDSSESASNDDTDGLSGIVVIHF